MSSGDHRLGSAEQGGRIGANAIVRGLLKKGNPEELQTLHRLLSSNDPICKKELIGLLDEEIERNHIWSCTTWVLVGTYTAFFTAPKFCYSVHARLFHLWLGVFGSMAVEIRPGTEILGSRSSSSRSSRDCIYKPNLFFLISNTIQFAHRLETNHMIPSSLPTKSNSKHEWHIFFDVPGTLQL